MLKTLRSLLAPAPAAPVAAAGRVAPPARLSAPGAADFDVLAHRVDANGLPLLDWDAVHRWVDAIPDDAAKAQAWSDGERAWLHHLCASLGEGYREYEQGSAILVSSLEGHVAEATLAFMNKTLQRILRVLDGVGEGSDWGYDILLVFDDEESYYRYVAHYYPEAGAYAASSGMYINFGCGHFATVKADLRAIEPVIAHEMTHSCLGHLPIPAWLNEGIAVNTEQRLCPPARHLHSQQMHDRHRQFWGPAEIQQFWSGKSFLRTDEGNELSYDLARIIVAQFAADWDSFRPFVLSALGEDGGAGAASEHLGLTLGSVVAALLELEPAAHWEPDPAAWDDPPERGAFSGRAPADNPGSIFSRGCPC
jgi:hypothetical protein